MMSDPVSARWVYNEEVGNDAVGTCFVCKKKVTNYVRRRFRICVAFHRSGKPLGYCHQSCYNRWNSPIGRCRYCGKTIRRMGTYLLRDGDLHCEKCWHSSYCKDDAQGIGSG